MRRLSIRSSIFLSTLSLLIVLPLAAYYAFAVTSSGYMRKQASEELNALLAAAGPVVRRVVDVGNGAQAPPPGLAEHYRSAFYFEALNPLMHADAQLVLFNADAELLYPRGFDFGGLPLDAADAHAFLNAGRAAADTMLEAETADGHAYLYCVQPVGREGDPVRYMLAYSPLYDLTVLMERAARLVLIVTAWAAAVCLPAAWWMARRISAPLSALCAQVDRIGADGFYPVPREEGAQEIAALSRAVGRMSGRLAHNEAAQKAFFQNASHELRTPLTSLQGYAEGLRHEVFDDPREIADEMLHECARLSGLVDDLLTLSRMDHDSHVLELVPIGVQGFLAGQLERLRTVAGARGVSLRLVADERLEALADEQLLARVTGNLLSNGIRYARTQVLVTAHARAGVVEVLVEDDGPGFAPAELPRLFDRFYKGQGGQFGLGLAIAKSAAEYMGGSLYAEQTAGGARFVLRLRGQL